MSFPLSASTFLARYRLLLCLVLLSLLLHVGTIALVELRLPRPTAPTLPARLDVRLAAGSSAISLTAAPAPRSVPDTLDPFTPLPAAWFAPAPLAPPPPPPPAPARPSQAPVILGFADPAPPPLPDTAPEMTDTGGEGPGYYQSAPPYSATVEYRVTRSGGGTPVRDDGTARLDWETDGSTYRLALDGVLGELGSEGGLDDRGLAPLRARESFGPGLATTLFDRRQEVIVSAIGAWQAPMLGSSQDTASVLIQLAGMGRSLEAQLQSVVKLWVGGAAGARLELYRMAGRVTIETGIGPLDTVRMTRLDAPGTTDAPQLEVWFAPQHGWLPVQLRLTARDGSVRTQTVSAISAGTPAVQ